MSGGILGGIIRGTIEEIEDALDALFGDQKGLLQDEQNSMFRDSLGDCV